MSRKAQNDHKQAGPSSSQAGIKLNRTKLDIFCQLINLVIFKPQEVALMCGFVGRLVGRSVSHPGPEKNFASRNTRLGDQLRWKIGATCRRINFVLHKSIGRIQRN